MQPWARTFACALVALAAGTATAAGQTAGAQRSSSEASPEFESAHQSLRKAEAYQALCEDLRANNRENEVLSSLLGKEDQAFRNAVGQFCANGVFVLDFSAGKGEACVRRKLDGRYRDFIRNMHAVRADVPVRLVRLTCVDLAGPLAVTNLNEGGIQLSSVAAERVFVAYSKLQGGIRINNSTITEGLGVYASTLPSPVTISQSTFGNNPRWNLAMGFVDSTIDSISIGKETSIGGTLDISGLSVLADLSISGKDTRIEGAFNARGAKIAGALRINAGTAIKGISFFDYARLGRLELDNVKFESQVQLEHAQVDKQILIRNGTRFAANVYANYMRTHEFRVQNAVFDKLLALSGADIGALRIIDSESTPDCKDCQINLGNANVHNVLLRNVRGMRVAAGNARVRTFDVLGGQIRGLNCTDCQVDQYMLLASRFSGLTNLSGAEIGGTLIFSDGDGRACWEPGAELNISELRADAIAAYAQDLMIDANPEAAECTKATGEFVNTRLTGARYRTLTAGRFDKGKLDRQDPNVRPLVALGSAHLTALIASSAAAGREPGRLYAYDPQPYEELAQALDRAGESEKAVDLRVAKIDARLESVTNPLILGWFWFYKLVSRYGFENSRAVVIFLVVLAIGASVYVSARGRQAAELWARRELGTLLGLVLYGLWFSLDRAIPPLNLDPHMHDSSGLSWRARNYFYCHRVIGTLLISVAAAGAAGLGH